MPRDAEGRLGAILWIDGIEHRLDNGDYLVWDDTYTHEVLEGADKVRIALLLDVWRHGMPADMSALSHIIVGLARLGMMVKSKRFAAYEQPSHGWRFLRTAAVTLPVVLGRIGAGNEFRRAAEIPRCAGAGRPAAEADARLAASDRAWRRRDRGNGHLHLTGIGAGLAGPAVIVSFALCGVICGCAALCYAEMSTLMPVAGSAYTYSYAVLGELVAWIIGWSLVLEYTVAAAAVAVGWSAHFTEFLHASAFRFPRRWRAEHLSGGILDLPAVVIGCAVTALLVIGTRESATINMVLVGIKLAALVLFVVLASRAFDPARFHPFAP